MYHKNLITCVFVLIKLVSLFITPANEPRNKRGSRDYFLVVVQIS